MGEVKRVECAVSVESQCLLGSYTNAFRILDSSEDECLLDFLLYSEVENQAVLVSRVRVHPELLPEIRGTLGNALRELLDVDLDIGIHTIPHN
jgi:hypothetical protein